MKTLEQAIHDYLWKHLSSSMDVYESRPMKEVSYPFADFDNFESRFNDTKTGALGQVTAMVNIWDSENNRKNVSEKSYGLIQAVKDVRSMYDYSVSVHMNGSTVQITQDNTVTPPVWRGIVTIVFDI